MIYECNAIIWNGLRMVVVLLLLLLLVATALVYVQHPSNTTQTL